jgi:hypothetical protein
VLPLEPYPTSLRQNTCGKYLKKERLTLTHAFRGPSPWPVDSFAFRLVVRQKHHGGRIQ